jgi:hypothetical protein
MSGSPCNILLPKMLERSMLTPISWVQVEFLMAEREAHSAPMFDLGIPFKDIGQQTKKLRSWLMDKI